MIIKSNYIEKAYKLYKTLNKTHREHLRVEIRQNSSNLLHKMIDLYKYLNKDNMLFNSILNDYYIITNKYIDYIALEICLEDISFNTIYKKQTIAFRKELSNVTDLDENKYNDLIIALEQEAIAYEKFLKELIQKYKEYANE